MKGAIATITCPPSTGARLAAGSPLVRLVSTTFDAFAGGDAHPCLGARSVVHRSACTLRMYGELAGLGVAEAVQEDVAAFAGSLSPADGLRSFVAVFSGPAPLSEPAFSALLWRQLQQMHDIDSLDHGWDPAVSADPQDPRFSYSIAGTAFFIVGLHAASSRWARRFAWPTLVFNPHAQFVAMRESGKYERARTVIRGRDTDLQGFPNPVLRDHGGASEARQYAGEAVGESWRCPLVVHERR